LGVDACIHDGFVSFLNLNNAVSKEYLFHFFYFIRPYIIQKHKQGVTQVNLNTKIVSEFDLLLPPAEEQHQIVAKIEELFSELDNGIESLKKAREQLKTYRQAVLKYAFEGELTGGKGSWKELLLEEVFDTIDGDRGKNYPKKADYLTKGYCLFLSTKNVRPNGFLFDERIFISKEKHQILRAGKLERGDIVITTRGTLGNCHRLKFFIRK
jgi:type I restriction enzyme S subunit